jgi:hypothetical protein
MPAPHAHEHVHAPTRKRKRTRTCAEAHSRNSATTMQLTSPKSFLVISPQE